LVLPLAIEVSKWIRRRRAQAVPVIDAQRAAIRGGLSPKQPSEHRRAAMGHRATNDSIVARTAVCTSPTVRR